MALASLPTAPLRVADLPQNSEAPFDLRPGAEELAVVADYLELLGLRKLSFKGTLQALGHKDWELNGTLGATVIQPCVVTLDPVTTRIDVPVRRQFTKTLEVFDEEEVEMPEDEAIEPLGTVIDPAKVMLEALALALPLYPRKEGASLDNAVFSEPGVAPMTDQDARPFAGLAALRNTPDKED
ncbi:MAG: YceD family protein [Paracoccaceae bacterium]